MVPGILVARNFWLDQQSVWIAGRSGPSFWRLLLLMAVCAGGMAPFALVAGWRTFVHACGYLEGKGRTGQSILEAIALGAAVPIFILVPLVAVRLFDAPLQAAAYVLAYALIGAVVGFVFGAVLSVTALAVTSLASILSD